MLEVEEGAQEGEGQGQVDGEEPGGYTVSHGAFSLDCSSFSGLELRQHGVSHIVELFDRRLGGSQYK